MEQLPLIIPTNQKIEQKNEKLLELAALADEAAALTVIQRYQLEAAENTLKRQRANLNLFAEYLAAKGSEITGDELYCQVEAWARISHGLVEGFKLHLVGKGYALTSVNVMLSSIKTYARLAHQAKVIDADVYSRIKAVLGFSGRRATEVNKKRPVNRISTEKSEPILVPETAIKRAKSETFYQEKDKNGELKEPTPARIRDRFVMCLLFDLGLRASEVANLKIGDVDPEDWTINVYRVKTDHTDRLNMTRHCITSYEAYAPHMPTFGGEPMMLASRKGGQLVDRELTRITVNHLVKRIGKRLAVEFGLENLKKLSPHDCRHSWATHAAKAGTPAKALETAGGWASGSRKPLEYIIADDIANEEVKLPY